MTLLKAQIILLDVEGTTTPISFVYDKLFPFARKHMRSFLEQCHERPEISEALLALKEENARDRLEGAPVFDQSEQDHGSVDAAIAYCFWLMDRDRKTTPLKTIQGHIWQEGFSRQELHSEVFPDVAECFTAWRRQGKRIAIYSSGSVAAQKLVFANTAFGDLTPHIEAFFDTHVGGKKEAESYRHIARTLKSSPPEVLFISDVPAELDAAAAAGMSVALSVRPGHPEHPNPADYLVLRSFTELD
jgi:enolase-phosphatase E1